MGLKFTISGNDWLNTLSIGIVNNDDIAWCGTPCGVSGHNEVMPFVDGYWRPNPKPLTHTYDYKVYAYSLTCGSSSIRTGYKRIFCFPGDSNNNYFQWNNMFPNFTYRRTSSFPASQPAHNTSVTTEYSTPWSATISQVIVPNWVNTADLQRYFANFNTSSKAPRNWFIYSQTNNHIPPIYFNDFYHITTPLNT